MRYIIGVDPDMEASGFAVWDKKQKKIIFHASLPFHSLIEKVKELQVEYGNQNMRIHIEAGWTNKKANFRKLTGSKELGESIARKVGENHGCGKLLLEYCKSLGAEVLAIKPMWKGAGNKTGSSYTPKGRKNFEKIYGFKVGTINDEERDAIALCYGY